MTMKLVTFALALGLAGCEQMARDQDKATKQQLVGHWLLEADAGRENALLREHIVHSADGKFSLERMLVGKDGVVRRENESGSWFVTEGLYKLRIEYIGREQLPNSKQLYSTCKIESLSPEKMVCVNAVDRWTKEQRRVSNDFKL